MTASPEFASRAEAAKAVLGGLDYLATVDPAQLPAGELAELLRVLERAHALETAARAQGLAAFTAAQGYHEDACYGPKSWLMNELGVTKGAAAGYLSWARRAAAHPRVIAALAARQMSESFARTICDWTGKLPAGCQDSADAILIAAALAGASLGDLARLAAEIYARSRPPDPDGPQDGFDDRSVRLETTFEGAGVLGGDLTPGCAAVVGAVLDALSAPAGAGDLRTHAQRYHDALAEAMQRLLGAGLLPERAGQPVRAWVHMSLAELLALDGDGALLGQWTDSVRARWAGHRAAASVAGSDGAAWLDGAAAAAVSCDALVSPVVTGDVDPGALDGLVRLCVELDRLGPGTSPDDADREPAAGSGSMAREALQRAIIGKAVELLSGPGGLRRLPAPPAARRPAGRAQPAAGHRLQRHRPGRHPPRRHPARPALPVGRRLPPARRRLPGPPRPAQGQRRPHQRQRLHSAVLFPPSGGDPPVGLDTGPERRRDDHRVEPGPQQGPAQPQPARPSRVTPPARHPFLEHVFDTRWLRLV